MSNGITSLVWPVALSLLFAFTGCAKDRTALVGVAGGGGCGSGGCGGAGGFAGTPCCHATGGAAVGQQPMAQQQLMASGNGVIQNKICPVMGEPLGSMGDPVPVTVGGETLFVCCRGCVEKVKADPAKYFAIARNE